MTQAAVGTLAPVVTVNGSQLPGEKLNSLIGLRVSSAMRIPSRAVLEFLDDGFAISTGGTFNLGAKIEVKTSDGVALFTGEVTGVELDVDQGAPNLSVTADDAAYKMTLGTKVRTFTKVSYSDVVGTIASQYGISVNKDSTSGVHDYLLQSDSDFGFLTEIADRVGFDWWVDATGTLQFHPIGSSSGSAPSVDWLSGLRNFSVSASALHPQKVTVNGWDPQNKQPVTTSDQQINHQPTASLVGPYLQASALSSHSEVITSHRMFDKQSDGTALAGSAVARWVSGAVTATGLCLVNPAIKVGTPVSVQNVGPASGSYPVTEVEHIYSLQGFDTRFTAGDRQPTSLVDTIPAAPPASSFRQDGLVVGVVTNVGGSGAPAGQVKVKFPQLGDQIESSWARVLSVGAGGSRGMTFLPEVNDEVIVGFEGGDITRPVVLGGLYNGRDAALDFGTQDGAVVKRQIVSRLGHVIELGDGNSPADQHIWLTLAGGEFLIKLGKDGLTATVPSGQPVTVSSGNTKMSMDKQGGITLDGQKITIKATQDVEISGLNVKLKANVALEGSGTQVKMTGTGQAELTSSGQTAVKGSVVMIN